MGSVEEGGGTRSIECPECHTAVQIDLPRSAEVDTVTTSSDRDEDGESGDEDRRRALRKTCPRDHLVKVVYEW